MKYLSGIHALNIPCNLETCGDWHQSAIKWNDLDDKLKESSDSIFKDYGIQKNITLTFLEGQPTYNVANHIRACLDLISEGNFSLVQGMNRDFIVNNAYDKEIFEKVYLLNHLPIWNNIDSFMGKEYKMKWLKYKEEKNDKI